MSEAAGSSRDAAADARETLRRLWDALPAFLVSGSAVCVATGAALWLGRGFTPVTMLVFAVVAGPLYAALVDQASRALDGDAPSALSLGRALRRSWRRALTLLVPPALTGGLALVALYIAGRTGSWLPLVPAGVGAALTVLLTIAALIGLPIASTPSAPRGARLTITALHAAAQRPVPTLGTIAVVVIATWAALQLSGTLLFLLPAPLAVVSAIAARPPQGQSEPEAR